MQGGESPWKATKDLLDGLGLNPFAEAPTAGDDAARQLEERRRQQERDLQNAPRPSSWGAN